MSQSKKTSAVDNKKNKSKKKFDLKYFGISVALIIFLIFMHFSLGGMLLYATKLGQSNILPTEPNCFPYTDFKPNIETIPINIFKNTIDDREESMKILFPYNEYNSKNLILDMFRNYKNKSDSNFLANYFISIFESLLAFNYNAFNIILNAFNSTLPENVILLIGPLLFPLLLIPVFLIQLVYFIYLWIANLTWFFKTNTNKDTNSKPVWENISVLNPIQYGISIWLASVFLFMLLMIIIFALPVLPSLAMTWCVLSIMGYKASLNDEEVGIFSIIKDVFKNFKKTAMTGFSIGLIFSAFKFLGNIPGYFSILTVIFVFMGIISSNSFTSDIGNNLSPISSYNQAKKTCDFKENIKNNSLFSSFMPSFLKGGGSNGIGGGDIIKELKNLNKKISKQS